MFVSTNPLVIGSSAAAMHLLLFVVNQHSAGLACSDKRIIDDRRRNIDVIG
jgi:hypothetical protein